VLPAAVHDAVAVLGKFAATEAGGVFIARTGDTGEDGFEIVVAENEAVALWNRLLEAGVRPAGVGARDTLRLEAGMNLYGQDMDEAVTPWEAGLAWTVALGGTREFIGRSALEAQKAAGVPRRMVGVVLDEKGVQRHGQQVVTDQGDGEILSGSFSPTLGKSIGFARVPEKSGAGIQVEIRGRKLLLRVVKYPFVRDGKACKGV
jgi:aminomethyltransferase